MKKRHFCLILMVAILPIAAHANHYTISFTGTGSSTGSFDYTTTTTVFSSFLVNWPAVLGTTPFGLTGIANSPTGASCGTPTAALAFAPLQHSLTPCPSSPGVTYQYQWNAAASPAPDGNQTFNFSYGPAGSTQPNIATDGTAYCSTCTGAVGNFDSWTISPGVGSRAPEPPTLGLLGVGLLTGIGALRCKLLL